MLCHGRPYRCDMKGTYEAEFFMKQGTPLHKPKCKNMEYANFSPHKAFASSQSTSLALQISSSNFSIFSDGYGLIDKIGCSLTVTRTMVLKGRMNLSNTSIYRNIHHRH